MLRQTRSSLTDAAMVTFEDWVLPPGAKIAKGANRGNRHSYCYPNGSEVVLCGLDDVTRLMSSEYDMIYIQELIEVREDDYELILTRLRGQAMPYRQLLSDTNPGAPTHWIKKRQSISLKPTTHEDNPIFYDHATGTWTELGLEYLGTLDTMTGHRKARMRWGEWVAAEGSRFPDLDEKVHQFDFRKKWPQGIPNGYHIILGLDYGLRAPYCCLWIAIDYDGNLWVFREDYKPGFQATEQATRVVDLTRSNEQIRYVYADPSIWSAKPNYEGQTDERSTADYYEEIFGQDDRFGPLLRGFNKSRRHALDTLDALFGRDNGFPDLYIDVRCTHLWQELTEAVWDSRGKLEIREDIDPSCADHAITALYYAVHTWLEKPEMEEQWKPPTPSEMVAIRTAEQNEKMLEAFLRRGKQRWRRF